MSVLLITVSAVMGMDSVEHGHFIEERRHLNSGLMI